MTTIRTFIMATSVLVSVMFFGSAYFIVSHSFTRTMQANSLRTSQAVAQSTFNSMFQLMSTGWTHAQAENFLRASEGAMKDSDVALRIYRGSIVSARFGPIQQGAMDTAVTQVFRTGKPEQNVSGTSTRYVFPLRAQTQCLRCHTNAQVGNVLGVIDVRRNLTPSIQAARHDFFRSCFGFSHFPSLGPSS